MAIEFGTGPAVGGQGVALAKGIRLSPAPDPLADVDYTGDLQKDSAEELTALQAAYRERAKQEAKRFQKATDSEFWVALCFTSREEKEQFLKRFHLLQLGDKYLNGEAVAQELQRQSRRPK